jgi:arginyl-tRNA synthetase
LEKLLSEACHKLFPQVEITEKMYSIGISPVGDYRTSLPFQLSHKVKQKPQEVARALADEMQKSTLESRSALKAGSEGVEATGQGFISFTFSNSWLAHQSTHSLTHQLRSLKYDTPRRIIIDHGSPNMSKEFHVGHLRSILIGDCLARVLRHQGHYVETVSHVGDYGTPMGLVIAHAMRTRKWASNPPESKELPSPSELSELYIEAKALQKNDPELALLIVDCVREIQKLDPDTANPHVMQVYQLICEASRKGFDSVYKDLDVTIPEKGESFYGKFVPSTIAELSSKNLLVESEGAFVCQLESWKAPLIVEKSDKTWLYGTTDLASLRHRLKEGKFDELLYVVDFTQHQHFEQVFEVARKAGWYDPEKVRVEHVHFGVVQGSNGTKLSSRDGTPLKLRQLLDNAVIETKSALIAARSLVRADRQDQEAEPQSMEEKQAEPTRSGSSLMSSVSPTSLALAEENAPTVAYNAIKYFELSQTRTQNYIFSFQQMLSLKGNTSFYIIYAYARIHTLYRRASEQGVAIPELSNDETSMMTMQEVEAITQKERDLALKILQFPDIMRSVETSLMPHTLSAHIFQTAQKFHSFYETCRVIGSPNQDFRFKLCKATEQMLHKGLDLLNVNTVNHV